MSKLIRRFVIALVLLLIVGIIGVSVAVWRLNSIVAAFSPTIEKEIARVTGSKVKLGAISASLFPRVRASLASAEISDSRGPHSRLVLNNVAASISLRQLLAGTLKVVSLEFDKPNLTVVRSKDGTYLEGLGNLNQQDLEKPAGAPRTDPATSSTRETDSNSLSIDMERIGVSGGTITFKDVDAQREIALTDLSADASVLLSKNMINVSKIDLSGKIGDSLPVSIAGGGLAFDLRSKQATIQDATISPGRGTIRVQGSGSGSVFLSGDPIDIAGLVNLASHFSPLIASYKASGSIQLEKVNVRWEPTVVIEGPMMINDLSAVLPSGHTITKGSGRLTVEVTPEQQRAESPAFTFAINGAPIEAKINVGVTADRISADTCSVKGFSGAATLPFQVTLGDPKQFSTNLTVAGMDLHQLLSFAAPPHAEKIRGTLTDTNLRIGMALGGRAAPSVSGKLAVKDGAFKGFNVAAAVLKKAEAIPALGAGISARIPERFKPFVSSSDTAIKDLKLNLQLANHNAQISGLVLVSDFFTLTSDGSYALDSGRVSLRSNIAFSPEFSQALVASAKELKSVLSADGRIQVPLLIEGTPPGVVVTPDFERVIKLGAERLIKEKAGDLLEKAIQKNLGGGRGDPLKKALGGMLGF